LTVVFTPFCAATKAGALGGKISEIGGEIMFLHLGDDVLTQLDQVIVIINSENPIGVSTNRDFLEKSSALGLAENIDVANNKAIIITDQKVYWSPISAHTLKKRAHFISELADPGQNKVFELCNHKL
jgi:hypothetical protein